MSSGVGWLYAPLNDSQPPHPGQKERLSLHYILQGGSKTYLPVCKDVAERVAIEGEGGEGRAETKVAQLILLTEVVAGREGGRVIRMEGRMQQYCPGITSQYRGPPAKATWRPD